VPDCTRSARDDASVLTSAERLLSKGLFPA
jgi:hypothetical protein